MSSASSSRSCYILKTDEIDRLKNGLTAALAIPFIDDIEDYIWEAVFAYARNLNIIDPLSNTRAKLLFDIVDVNKKIGWSCKALQWPLNPGCEFELVIQRADIFTKATSLGFGQLNLDSSPAILGEALLKHWQQKVDGDAATQGVTYKNVAILIKTRARNQFAFYEDSLIAYEKKDIKWAWTDATKTGLQGRRVTDNFCVYRWYPNQKQFFERFLLPKEAFLFDIKPARLLVKDVVEVLLSRLKGKP